jgi:hypothetical protein
MMITIINLFEFHEWQIYIIETILMIVQILIKLIDFKLQQIQLFLNDSSLIINPLNRNM